jgi:hypothetical protein
MKPLLRITCLAALIYLQSCGGGMIKNKTDDSTKKQPTVVASKVPVPVATSNRSITTEKDLNGYWVGLFEPDTTVTPLYAQDHTVWNYVNKINVSIDEINGDNVSGHSVVAGNLRPFTGTMEKDGDTYWFTVKEPGDDEYDGKFEFHIKTGDTVLSGTWRANKKVTIPARKYRLTKQIFKYNPANAMGSRFVDWTKIKASRQTADDGTKYMDTSFYMTSEDLYKYNPSTTPLTKTQVANLKKSDIFILRNSIYARHGYSFKKQPLRVFFDEQDWYIPISNDVKSELTPLEKQNITLLMRYEKNAKEYYDVFGR